MGLQRIGIKRIGLGGLGLGTGGGGILAFSLANSFIYELWEITGAGSLVGKKRGDILTVGGTAGSYTFQVPNTSPYKILDTDYIWFKTDVTWRTTTEAELIGYDFARTIVEYDNISPYLIKWVAVLTYGATLTTAQENTMRDYCKLSRWWGDVLSFHGVLKGNRLSERSVFTPESVAPNGDCTNLVATTYSFDKIDLVWQNGSNNEDGIAVQMSTDGTNWGAPVTLAAGTLTYRKTGLTIDTRYWFRVYAYKGAFPSAYSNTASDWTSCVVREIVDSNADGLADYYEYTGSGYAMTCIIVTGNGFTGNAQRVVENNADNWLYLSANFSYTPNPVKLLTIGVAYVISGKWRSNGIFRVYTVVGGGITYPGVNTGNALPFSVASYTPAAEGGRAIIFETIECNPGCWLEMNDLIIKRKIV